MGRRPAATRLRARCRRPGAIPSRCRAVALQLPSTAVALGNPSLPRGAVLKHKQPRRDLPCALYFILRLDVTCLVAFVSALAHPRRPQRGLPRRSDAPTAAPPVRIPAVSLPGRHSMAPVRYVQSRPGILSTYTLYPDAICTVAPP